MPAAVAACSGELRSQSPKFGYFALRSVPQKQRILYSELETSKGKMAVLEGDIILGTAARMAKSVAMASVSLGMLANAAVISGEKYRWPRGEVPYDIDPTLPKQNRVTDAIKHWGDNTRIRFRPKLSSDDDWVSFVPDDGCAAQVGRQGGQQFVMLGGGCTVGNTIHEIGHTLGLWHEQSRSDRDEFIEIDYTNISAAFVHNFDQHVTDGDDVGPYDYGSIMHYPANAFAIDQSKHTIKPLKPLPAGVVLGQRTGLSAGDIAAIESIYG